LQQLQFVRLETLSSSRYYGCWDPNRVLVLRVDWFGLPTKNSESIHVVQLLSAGHSSAFIQKVAISAHISVSLTYYQEDPPQMLFGTGAELQSQIVTHETKTTLRFLLLRRHFKVTSW
jgi:hypothetical protein